MIFFFDVVVLIVAIYSIVIILSLRFVAMFSQRCTVAVCSGLISKICLLLQVRLLLFRDT